MKLKEEWCLQSIAVLKLSKRLVNTEIVSKLAGFVHANSNTETE